MKQIIITLIILLILGLAIPNPVLSFENEAAATATLSFQQVSDKNERSIKLARFLSFYNSPLSLSAEHFVQEADRLNLDWRLVAAIAGVESTFGKHIPKGSYNAWGWGIPTGKQTGLGFPNWEEGITAVSEGLRYNYVDKGALNIEQIGRIYAASPRWAGNVRFFLSKIDNFSLNDPELLTVTL